MFKIPSNKLSIYPKLNRYLVLFSMFLISLFSLFSCGGNSSPVAGLDENIEFIFPGLSSKSIKYDEKTGQYTISLAHPEPAAGIYKIYKRFSNGNYDFNNPWKTTTKTQEITYDLRFEPTSCFLAKWSPNKETPFDSNQNEFCTTHTPFIFSGINSLTRTATGNYLLQWDVLPAGNPTYEVFTGTRSKPEEISFALPAWQTTQNFLDLNDFFLGDRMCFTVRFRTETGYSDTNTITKCTEDNLLSNFTGISSVFSPEFSKVLVQWVNSTNPVVAGYTIRVYETATKREICSKKVTTNIGATSGIMIESGCNLIGGQAYYFGVRAFDIGEHEDTNEKKICTLVLSPDSYFGECPTE